MKGRRRENRVIARFELVTDLRRPGFHVLKAVVTHGPFPVLVARGSPAPDPFQANVVPDAPPRGLDITTAGFQRADIGESAI